MQAVMEISVDSIRSTERLIRPYIRTTPVIEVAGAEFGLGNARLVLKLELLQHTGSFKVRGAFANLLSSEVPDAGVVAASGGNHGVAVAFAAGQLGKPARIFLPTVASPSKIEKIRSYGAHLVIAGERYADALAASQRWQEESGALPVHAYDQVGTLLGQGSLGLEIDRQSPDIDTLLVAVGGGGLIGGIASYFAERIAKRKIRIVGVEPELAPTLSHALAAGKPVDSPAGGIAADSLAPKRVGEIMFPIAKELVDRVILVSDDSIRAAQQSLWDLLRVAPEPGGAAAMAALLSHQYEPARDERVGVIVCGGNTTAVDFSRSKPTS
jgi:threonine dehydratase